MNEILQVAMLAGQMILENGGETYRVEETIYLEVYYLKIYLLMILKKN